MPLTTSLKKSRTEAKPASLWVCRQDVLLPWKAIAAEASLVPIILISALLKDWTSPHFSAKLHLPSAACSQPFLLSFKSHQLLTLPREEVSRTAKLCSACSLECSIDGQQEGKPLNLGKNVHMQRMNML